MDLTPYQQHILLIKLHQSFDIFMGFLVSWFFGCYGGFGSNLCYNAPKDLFQN
jgi:hypothetical protein